MNHFVPSLPRLYKRERRRGFRSKISVGPFSLLKQLHGSIKIFFSLDRIQNLSTFLRKARRRKLKSALIKRIVYSIRTEKFNCDNKHFATRFRSNGRINFSFYFFSQQQSYWSRIQPTISFSPFIFLKVITLEEIAAVSNIQGLTLFTLISFYNSTDRTREFETKMLKGDLKPCIIVCSLFLLNYSTWFTEMPEGITVKR